MAIVSFAAGCAPTQTAAPIATRTVLPPAPIPTLAATAVPPAQAPTVAPTTAAQLTLPQPDCSQGVTPAQTEGPYYKANTPERASLLEPGMAGTKIVVTGYVLTRNCRPIARAWLDFWQADDKGEYDNRGYSLRGHLFTDADGRYTLETILPGLYPGRTRHIHVKVQAPNQPIVTTQLYFPEVQQNNRDGIYKTKLLVTWQDVSGAKVALYNFVLNVN
ncbi:MAG: dioxygenase [Chloroflexi bacterium]|nr:dioxygenase [Chloroflexota bacterium]